jgi:hypothetical protein
MQNGVERVSLDCVVFSRMGGCWVQRYFAHKKLTPPVGPP